MLRMFKPPSSFNPTRGFLQLNEREVWGAAMQLSVKDWPNAAMRLRNVPWDAVHMRRVLSAPENVGTHRWCYALLYMLYVAFAHYKYP